MRLLYFRPVLSYLNNLKVQNDPCLEFESLDEIFVKKDITDRSVSRKDNCLNKKPIAAEPKGNVHRTGEV